MSKLRHGFTTGSCAAAAAKAAAMMLLGNCEKTQISIITPAGIPYETAVGQLHRTEKEVTCAVQKDAGDDPDVTNEIWIYATVSMGQNATGAVLIDGGIGVGRVTRPGLDQPIGNAAINSVPRQMIQREVKEVMEFYDCKQDLQVMISAPEGVLLAEKTFNPRLGIEGGISIIGTSGIVEPMSTKALLDTIYISLRQKKEEGYKIAVVSPGNYGMDFMKNHYGYELDAAVKCSNFIGETIDMVKELGYEKMLLVGHMGKLIKVSGGIMNTHSKEADCRAELMAVAAFRAGADRETVEGILQTMTTVEAYEHVRQAGLEEGVSSYLMERIQFYLKKRGGENMDIQCMMFTNEHGLIGETKGAAELMQEAITEEAHGNS